MLNKETVLFIEDEYKTVNVLFVAIMTDVLLFYSGLQNGRIRFSASERSINLLRDDSTDKSRSPSFRLHTTCLIHT